MKKTVLTIAVFIAAVVLVTGGIYLFQNQNSGEKVIAAETNEPAEPVEPVKPADEPAAPAEDQAYAVNVYEAFTDEQMETIKPRVEENMARVADGGEPLGETEIGEIFNYILGVAVRRLNIEILGVWLADDVYETYGASAICNPSYPGYDKERGVALLPVAVDRQVYDNAKSSADALIRLLYVLVHEVGHGVETDTANKPASLMGLAFNLYYDAVKVIPEYIAGEFNTDISEMAADVFACSVMLDEFSFILEKVKIELINTDYLWTYTDLLTNRSEQLLITVLPGMDAVTRKQLLNDVPMVPPVTEAYKNGTVTPNETLSALFDRGGSYGVPSYGEFIKYADEAFGIGKINARLTDEEIDGISVTDLKRFVLCAPFILGIEDVPYESYDKYLTGLHEQRKNSARITESVERVWVPEWVADIDNGEFAGIIEGYLG